MKTYIIAITLLFISGCLPYPIQGFIDNQPQSANRTDIIRFNYNYYRHKAIMLIGVSIHPDTDKSEFVIDLTRMRVASTKENIYAVKSINYDGENISLKEGVPLTLSIKPGQSYNIEYIIKSQNKISKKEFTERILTDTLIVLNDQEGVIGKCWFRYSPPSK